MLSYIRRGAILGADTHPRAFKRAREVAAAAIGSVFLGFTRPSAMANSTGPGAADIALPRGCRERIALR